MATSTAYSTVPYRVTTLVRPGRRLPAARLDRLVEELREVAATCFDEVPHYQALAGTRDELDHCVIALARDERGELAGFTSARLFDVPGVGTVFHLGLTCARPTERGNGLSHRLVSAVVTRYLLTCRPFGKVWVTNAACVLSSLGNVALHFDEVYPSPFQERPGDAHLAIARTLAEHHRGSLHIRAEARFDEARFVFEQGNARNVFAKRADDDRYFHRHGGLNRYFRDYMDLDAGDLALQVGHTSTLALLRHTVERAIRRGRAQQLRLLPESAFVPRRRHAAGM